MRPVSALLYLFVLTSLMLRTTLTAQTATTTANNPGPVVTYDDYHDTSIAVRNAPVVLRQSQPVQEIPLGRLASPRVGIRNQVASAPSGLVQSVVTPQVATNNLFTFEGISNFEGLVPPDPNSSVGATQIVETVNALYEVFTKTGVPISGPAQISSIWAASPAFGGVCQNGPSFGDPIVLYDKMANRWLIAEIASSDGFATGTECIAVSTTSDATGAYNRYAYSFAPELNDYPKFGVWPDAYYAGYNMFTSSGFAGALACAYDRAAMLAGSSAAQICIGLPVNLHRPQPFTPIPADLDGSTLPPTGEPNFIITAGGLLHKFHVDFQNPSNSTITYVATMGGSGAGDCSTAGCSIPQPGTSQQLDILGDREMYRLAYRNFGDHESLVTCATVLSFFGGGKLVGRSPEWLEIRNPNSSPTIFQSGTFTPDTTQFRWMCSIAMNKNGDIALGYSRSSSQSFPSIGITGRLKADALGSMRSETIVQAGGGSQTGTPRWGDYTSMSVDPVDDLTFVYTNEYYPSTSQFGWHTRISSFKLAP